jgi:hypothetical protein
VADSTGLHFIAPFHNDVTHQDNHDCSNHDCSNHDCSNHDCSNSDRHDIDNRRSADHGLPDDKCFCPDRSTDPESHLDRLANARRTTSGDHHSDA